jgi:hypothetical protein
MRGVLGFVGFFVMAASAVFPARAAMPPMNFTVNLSENVTVDTTGGTPRIAVDVGGTTRYASYTAGTGTSALTFTYTATAGDVDLDGVSVSSPVDLNGGTITDTAGNPLSNLTFTPPNTANVKVNFPSLSMDFVTDADGRYTLNGTAYNDLPAFLTATGGTFTRNSVGTYYDVSGVLQTATANTPRFDYDPVTHSAKGILIEESRTNLLLRSSEFDNAAWSKGNVSVTANTITAPDGTMSAEKFISNATLGAHRVTVATTVTSGNVYTISLYAKSSELSRLLIAHNNEPNGFTTFNLSSVTAVNASAATSKINHIGNGWYYCTVTSTMTGTSRGVEIWLVDNSGATSYTGDGTSGIYIWGAQLEAGAFATSYIPTTTAAVTRSADDLSVPYAAWFDSTKGTWMADAYSSPNTGNGRVVGTNGAGASTFLSWNGVAGNNIINWNGTSGLTATVSPVGSSSVSAKMAMKWNTSGPSRSLVANGGAVTSDASLPVTGTSFNVGGTVYLDSWVRKIKYYPNDVTNTQLQLLTQ